MRCMNNTIEPLNILSGIETLDNSHAGWTLDQAEGITADRHFTARVQFIHPFRRAPVVQMGIVGFDISNHDAARLSATVSRVTTSGFDINLSTWLNSRLWRVNLSWIAIGG
jgi:hypothetical protein